MAAGRNSIMRVFGYLFLFGGIVRLLADETVFNLFHLHGAWSEHAYFIYIYRVLGAFVILTGLVILQVSRDPGKHRETMQVLMWGFVVTGGVMLSTGILTGLTYYLFIPDALFAFFLAILFDGWRKNAG
jgi:hypothetical protein